ncbi:ssDNA endonuclease and repair protein rad10 [Tulasnella sp. 425]|nr:ssDNA endonuclease and repair protein rad10 [Tulasnella sp. 425]
MAAGTQQPYLGSLRYYRLHPEYLHRRIKELGTSFDLRILLFLIDAKDPENEIKELTKICLVNNLTIMAAWSMEEAAQYIMTYKAYENKPPTMIKERIDQDYNSILRNALTSIKGVNKTDVVTLRTTFGDFASMSRASFEQLQQCPGFAKTKARRVKDAFDKPFFPGRNANALGGPTQSSRKGKEKALGQGGGLPAPAFEGDLAGNADIEQVATGTATPPATRRSPQLRYSPDWDIDLDLNPSDEEATADAVQRNPSESPQPPLTKKRRPNPMDESDA